jgi:hypothetical protein
MLEAEPARQFKFKFKSQSQPTPKVARPESSSSQVKRSTASTPSAKKTGTAIPFTLPRPTPSRTVFPTLSNLDFRELKALASATASPMAISTPKNFSFANGDDEDEDDEDEDDDDEVDSDNDAVKIPLSRRAGATASQIPKKPRNIFSP